MYSSGLVVYLPNYWPSYMYYLTIRHSFREQMPFLVMYAIDLQVSDWENDVSDRGDLFYVVPYPKAGYTDQSQVPTFKCHL
jgi:hypothetical protein